MGVRDALMMTARLVRILGASATNPCGEVAVDGSQTKAAWEKGQVTISQKSLYVAYVIEFIW